jgi:FkbM family methyltransferase
MSRHGPVDFAARRVHAFRQPPEGEQELVRSYFGSRTAGFYVDVGANHPTVESQTWHLEQLGWSGILVEPQPDLCRLLREQRTGKVVQCACSSPANAGTQVPLVLAGGHSTLNNEPIARGTTSRDTLLVDCRTLDDVLESCAAPEGIDFMSVDIEGHEMEMFEGFTLSRWAPRLVLLEDHVTDHRKHRHMVANGYQVILRTGLNSWYVPQSTGFRLSVPARLEFVRKYWLGLAWRRWKFARGRQG